MKEAKLLLPEDNDWCLQKAAEGANSGIEISNTLQVSGFLVSGTLIGGRTPA